MEARLSMNHGFTCTCFTKVELVVSHRFPIVVESIFGSAVLVWGAKIKSTHSIPITDVSFPECYGNDMVQLPIPRNGIGMGLSDTNPGIYAMGNVWNFTKNIAIP